MELYHNDMSVCAQKVRLVLAEKGLSPTFHHLDLRAGDAHSPEYLKLNPNGVVPTLVDGGLPIIESTVICEYLDDACPEHPLRPADPYQRAQMRLWTMRPDAGLHRACGKTSFAIAFRFQAPERQIAAMKDPVRREEMLGLVRLGLDLPGIGEFVRQFARLVDDVAIALREREWLAGSAYSLADAAMLPYVMRLDQLQLGWLWRENPERAAVGEWLARCTARENFRGIGDYLNPKYLATMEEHGLAAREKVAALIG